MSCGYNNTSNSEPYTGSVQYRTGEYPHIPSQSLGTFNFAYAPAAQWAAAHQAQAFAVTQQEIKSGYPRISYEPFTDVSHSSVSYSHC